MLSRHKCDNLIFREFFFRRKCYSWESFHFFWVEFQRDIAVIHPITSKLSSISLLDAFIGRCYARRLFDACSKKLHALSHDVHLFVCLSSHVFWFCLQFQWLQANDSQGVWWFQGEAFAVILKTEQKGK